MPLSEPGPNVAVYRRYSAFRKIRLWFVSHYYCFAGSYIGVDARLKTMKAALTLLVRR